MVSPHKFCWAKYLQVRCVAYMVWSCIEAKLVHKQQEGTTSCELAVCCNLYELDLAGQPRSEPSTSASDRKIRQEKLPPQALNPVITMPRCKLLHAYMSLAQLC